MAFSSFHELLYERLREMMDPNRSIETFVDWLVGQDITLVVCNRDIAKAIKVAGKLQRVNNEVFSVGTINFKCEAINIIQGYDCPCPTVYIRDTADIYQSL